MKSITLISSALLLLLSASCKESKEDQIIGLWQEVAVINPEIDHAIRAQEAFADTVGKSTDVKQNLSLYGTDDIEAMRAALRANLDSFRQSQARSMSATQMEFRKDSMMYIHTMDGKDSSKWYLDEDGALIMDVAALKGGDNKIRMEVVHLSDTSLKLKYTENLISTTSEFKPVKK
jgi:hypothetical protein